MKYINKKDIEFTGSMLIYQDEVIALPRNIECAFAALDVALSEALDKLADEMAEKTKAEIDEKRASFDEKEPLVWFLPEPQTPVMDEEAARAKKLIEEIKLGEKIEKVNELIEEYKDLFEWVDSEKTVIINEPESSLNWSKLDYVNNPLVANTSHLVLCCMQMAGFTREESKAYLVGTAAAMHLEPEVPAEDE